MNLKEIATYIVIILIGIVVAQHMNVVVSGSMEPVMYRGDIVVYKATWVNEDVIHRVKEIYKTSDGNTYLITKGDNNPVPDPYPVQYPDQVVSKVVSINGQPLIIPKIGYITLWIRGL